MMTETRRDLIADAAKKLKARPKPLPIPKPGRTGGRWIKAGSSTITVYGAGRAVLADLIRRLVEAEKGRIEEGDAVKTHIQLFEKRRQG